MLEPAAAAVAVAAVVSWFDQELRPLPHPLHPVVRACPFLVAAAVVDVVAVELEEFDHPTPQLEQPTAAAAGRSSVAAKKREGEERNRERDRDREGEERNRERDREIERERVREKERVRGGYTSMKI